MWSWAWPRCCSRRGTGCCSSRRSRGRCWANCCRRRRRRCPRLLVKVSRTLPGVAVYRGVWRADQRGYSVPRQCGAEIVIHCSVAGSEHVGLAPVATRFGEQISLSLIGIATNGGRVCADEGASSLEGDRIAEVSVRRAVTRSELLSLAPTPIRFGEDVGRALKRMAINSRIVCADEGSACLESNRLTEAVSGGTVVRDELLGLAPSAIRLGENIDCTLGGVDANGGVRRTDQYGRAFEYD